MDGLGFGEPGMGGEGWQQEHRGLARSYIRGGEEHKGGLNMPPQNMLLGHGGYFERITSGNRHWRSAESQVEVTLW